MRICLYLLEKSLMGNFIFCAVHLSESMKIIVIANQFKNKIHNRTHFITLHSHFGGRETIKMLTDANKITGNPANMNGRT